MFSGARLTVRETALVGLVVVLLSYIYFVSLANDVELWYARHQLPPRCPVCRPCQQASVLEPALQAREETLARTTATSTPPADAIHFLPGFSYSGLNNQRKIVLVSRRLSRFFLFLTSGRAVGDCVRGGAWAGARAAQVVSDGRPECPAAQEPRRHCRL